jgi:hypothetical protein
MTNDETRSQRSDVGTKAQNTKKAKYQEPKNKSQTKLKEENSKPGFGFGFWIFPFGICLRFWGTRYPGSLRFEVSP